MSAAMPTDKPTVSVVTLTWNSARFIPPLLTTLLADAEHSQVATEIIVIDNGSTDESLELLQGFARENPSIIIVPLSENHGTTVSRNIGIRMARGEYVFILDSDTEVPKGALRGLVDSFDHIDAPKDRIGIVCPRLNYPDGGFQESARRFPTLFTKVYRLFRIEGMRAKDESLDDVIEGKTTPVDYAISAGWFIPRATFDQVGLLDERIFYSPEDVEFCARVWQKGLEVWYYPQVEIMHNTQRLTNKRPLSKLGLSHVKGLVRYWWEYDGFFSRPER